MLHTMTLLLTPDQHNPAALRQVYRDAVRNAEEIYIATAYLMDWSGIPSLNRSCKRLVFLVGTDFGLTRKSALLSLLKWLPKKNAFFCGAVLASGFHPKVVAWKTRSGDHHCLIGSSNLSKAGLSVNYEANVAMKTSAQEFKAIKEWVDSLVQDHAVPVNKDFIGNQYNEAKLGKARVRPKDVLRLKLMPTGAACKSEVVGRRKQQARFQEIAKNLRTAAVKTSRGEVTSSRFWEMFWEMWAHHDSRLQGSGLQFTGKGANWKQACGALVRILGDSETMNVAQLDQVVASQIDRLKKAANPCRGAWLSEMLCHYFPGLYPIDNGPVKKWLSANKWRSSHRGATEGQKYIDLAKQLRFVVKAYRPAGATNLAELDAAIWRWVHDNT